MRDAKCRAVLSGVGLARPASGQSASLICVEVGPLFVSAVAVGRSLMSPILCGQTTGTGTLQNNQRWASLIFWGSGNR
jgi:hypothetical protein